MKSWKEAETLAERLKLRMAERGLAQADLVRKTGLSPSYVSMLLSGNRGDRIGMSAAQNLRRVLQVPISFFSFGESHMGNRTWKKEAVGTGS